MAKRVTTLFIRDTGINLLVMKGRQVEKWASLPLEPGLVSQGLVVDEDRVAEKVEQLFKETGVQKKARSSPV
jgi:type IV pilus assembly protein PilM